ncbi:leukocyte surface antigen CD53-like [Tribolium madens]|uniref:leukocyte surface antigen CD53-like n=1 Tax=Tribolium madens TaxID=41895 RepID=UPI001CF751F1|nr:leukocyte surface antigen CD53-like [Tribolium madens]
MKFKPNDNILRIALTAFSVLFGILSISLITLGAIYIDELWWPRRFVGLEFIEFPILLIILGSLSLIMAVVGCICAKTDNKTFLLTFAGVLSTILCIVLAVGIIGFVNLDKHERGHSKRNRLLEQDNNKFFLSSF